MEYFIKLLDEEVLMNEDRHRDEFKRQTETLSILHARCLIKATEFPLYSPCLRYRLFLSLDPLWGRKSTKVALRLAEREEELLRLLSLSAQ